MHRAPAVSCRLNRLVPLAVAAVLLAGSTLVAGRFPVGHDHEGLPSSGAPLAAYAADPADPLNRLHALLFTARRLPTEIGATLPAERRRAGLDDAAFFTGKWALQNRKQVDPAADTAWFGGDVRTSPVESWTEAESAEARRLLADLATPAAAAQRVPAPLARLSLQWDLLQVWWRLERGQKTDHDTLRALARAIRALGQTRATLQALPSGLETLPTGDERDRRKPRGAEGLGQPGSDWVELDRGSQALFQAQRSLCSARVFVRSTDRATVEALVAAVPGRAAGNQLVEVPRGTETALVLGLVGLTADLEPVATPVASEVRLRMAMAEDRLDPASDTSTRDGWNQWVWLLSRERITAREASPLRFVPDSAQSLFLEYGTPKHTTYFAQCALCHRATNGGNQNPSGVHVLGKYAKASVLADPAKRLRDAEREMAPVVARLRERLASAP